MLKRLAHPLCCCTRIEHDLTVAACVMFVTPRSWSLIVLYSFLLCVLALFSLCGAGCGGLCDSDWVVSSLFDVCGCLILPVGSSLLPLLVVVVPHFGRCCVFPHLCVLYRLGVLLSFVFASSSL